MSTFYVTNPEGQHFTTDFRFASTATSGARFTGGTYGTESFLAGARQDLQTTTYVLGANGELKYTFLPGQPHKFAMWELLDIAGVNLDLPAPQSACSAPAAATCTGFEEPHNGKPFPQYEPPYNRMSGVLLEYNLELYNYGRHATSFDPTGASDMWGVYEVSPLKSPPICLPHALKPPDESGDRYCHGAARHSE